MKLTQRQREVMKLTGVELEDIALEDVSGGVHIPLTGDDMRQYEEVTSLIGELMDPNTTPQRAEAIRKELKEKNCTDIIARVLRNNY